MRIRRCVCLLGVKWPDTWHMVSKPLSCFHLLFTRKETLLYRVKLLSRRHARSLLQYVGNEHPSLRTPCLRPKVSQKKTPCLHQQFTRKTTAFFRHFERLLLLSSRMNAKTPCYSRDDVRYRRVNLETIDPCDLVDEENLHGRHVIDSSHFNIK